MDIEWICYEKIAVEAEINLSERLGKLFWDNMEFELNFNRRIWWQNKNQLLKTYFNIVLISYSFD